jgi:hypothetical protein
MIVTKCDICHKELSVYQTFRISTLTVHSNSPNLPSQPEKAMTFDLCLNGTCILKAFANIKTILDRQGRL